MQRLLDRGSFLRFRDPLGRSQCLLLSTMECTAQGRGKRGPRKSRCFDGIHEACMTEMQRLGCAAVARNLAKTKSSSPQGRKRKEEAYRMKTREERNLLGSKGGISEKADRGEPRERRRKSFGDVCARVHTRRSRDQARGILHQS